MVSNSSSDGSVLGGLAALLGPRGRRGRGTFCYTRYRRKRHRFDPVSTETRLRFGHLRQRVTNRVRVTDVGLGLGLGLGLTFQVGYRWHCQWVPRVCEMFQQDQIDNLWRNAVYQVIIHEKIDEIHQIPDRTGQFRNPIMANREHF